MDAKKIIISICGVVVVIGIALFVLFSGATNGYRVVKVYELEGVATVTRDDKGEIVPYNNMLLEAGDQVFLDTGNMTLKMDEDKYAYVEEKTDFSLYAEGNSQDSKTLIKINKGAITNEIQNPLNADASYEVNTPNSTMAVRGTVFRVYTYYDNAGICYTRVSVFEGSVVSKLVYPDGEVANDEVIISAGKEVIIYEDGTTTDYLTDVTEIDYSTLPQDVIDLINDILGIQNNTAEVKTTEETASEEASTTEGTTEQEKGKEASTTEGKTTEETSTTEEIAGEEASTTEEKNTEEASTTEESTTEEATTEEREYTVTFIYNGKVFATQQVTAGECATCPVLMPAKSGRWDFDFATPITEDIRIQWKE